MGTKRRAFGVYPRVLPRLTEQKRGTLYLLARHFFDRFFDREALSPGGEPETNVVQLMGFLAVPSAFFIILCQPMVMVRWQLVAVRNFFVSFSMIVMGFVMVFEWDTLFPDRRDYQILTPLPTPAEDDFRRRRWRRSRSFSGSSCWT